jgi:hypothetical protein
MKQARLISIRFFCFFASMLLEIASEQRSYNFVPINFSTTPSDYFVGVTSNE